MKFTLTYVSSTCMHTTHTHSDLQLLVMLSSAAAQDDGGRICMALPGEMSHTDTHTRGEYGTAVVGS